MTNMTSSSVMPMYLTDTILTRWGLRCHQSLNCPNFAALVIQFRYAVCADCSWPYSPVSNGSARAVPARK
jgi:hypothetical protein